MEPRLNESHACPKVCEYDGSINSFCVQNKVILIKIINNFFGENFLLLEGVSLCNNYTTIFLKFWKLFKNKRNGY